MTRLLLSLVMAVSLAGCPTIKLVSDYDEVIDKGTLEFAEQFNAHVKNMGDLGGTAEGTYEANLKTYNALEAKLEVLIARAASASEGKGCKLQKKMFDRVKSLLKDKMPAELRSEADSQTGNSDGCNERLLALVKDQLGFVREIHRDSDKCKGLTCIRPASAKDALEIANQSIRAVSIVETAKKTQ